MLISLMTIDRLPEWTLLAREVALLFGSAGMADDPDFMDFQKRVIFRKEALCAVDYASGSLIGVIAYSTKRNEITWFAVFNRFRGIGVGKKLLMTALRQLHGEKVVTVTTFTAEQEGGAAARGLYHSCGFTDVNEFDSEYGRRVLMERLPDGLLRGASFHYNIKEYMDESSNTGCPFCNGAPRPEGHVLIRETQHSVLEALMEAQGGLYGKCHIVYKGNHARDLYDLTPDELNLFMGDVSQAARALKRVTGAIKINMEFHGNTGAHLHGHLFPRYLDDAFPSAPIDYRVTEPCPYKDKEDFLLFIKRYKEMLEK